MQLPDLVANYEVKVKMKTALLLSVIAFLVILAATNSSARQSYLLHHRHLNASNATFGLDSPTNSTARRHYFPFHHGHSNVSNATFLQESDSARNSTARRHYFPRRHRHFNASFEILHGTDEEVNTTTRRHHFPRHHRHGYDREESYSARQSISRQRRYLNASIDEEDSAIPTRNRTFTRKRRYVNLSMDSFEGAAEPETNSTSSESMNEVNKGSLNETFSE